MNTGRNNPCPCGSGRKYKKCCMNSVSGTALTDTSPTDISMRIAYAGDFGRQREKWCKDYITWKTERLDKLTTDQANLASEKSKHISCTRGCWFCCSQYVSTSLQDAEAIVYWLHLHQDIRVRFMARYPEWRKKVRKNEKVYQQANHAASVYASGSNELQAFKELVQKTKCYQQLNILCPFLDQDACSIYPVRPFACATYIVVSPSEQCKSSSIEEPVQLLSETNIDYPTYI